MKVHGATQIRNVAVVGHNTVGKTTFISACLFAAGAVNRAGRVEDGTTVTDFDAEEVDRQISIGNSLAFAEWNKHKINFIDTPGYAIFSTEALMGLDAADAALVVVDSVSGVEVQTEKVWKFAESKGLPRMVVLNRMDRERADFERAYASIEGKFGRSCVPIQLPVGSEKDFKGIIDLVAMKMITWNEQGKPTTAPIPASEMDRAKEWHEKLLEKVAEGDDKLMERFFEQGSLSEEEVHEGLRREVHARQIFPVLMASASRLVGLTAVLDGIVDLLPSPQGRNVAATMRADKSEMEWPVDEGKPAGAFVVKTFSDPFSGRITVLRVYSGKLASDGTFRNLSRDLDERFGQLFLLQGKEHVAVPEAVAGDIVAVAKLKDTRTGDTLGAKDLPVLFPSIKIPEAAIAFAIEGKAKGDEDKIGTALAKLIDEDPSLHFERDEQTKEFHLSGSGQLHVEIAVARLKKRYGVEVILHPPTVPYRETIKAKADGHGRHKKQTGGHGQFADCKIKMEPLTRGSDFEFVDEIFGGAIPRGYIPAVEKGIQDARRKGFLAGYPVVDFRVRLIDGQYHDVDSSEMAFKIAGSLAFKDAIESARPTILEPVMGVEVYCPQEYMGDIMGDLNSRRGRVQGMDSDNDTQIIRAAVPMAEMLTYEQTLRSITQGRGSFHMEFDHYEEVPKPVQEKLIEKAKAAKAGEVEEEA
jgi:elongation factor G